MKVCQSKEGLSRYRGCQTICRFVNLRSVCQGKKGLSRYEWFVNLRRVVCLGMRGLSR